MAGPSPEADIGQRRLVFRVGEQSHEIDASLVMEVVRVPHMTRVPHGPEALAGIANLRGKPVPVLSMHRILGGGPRAAPPGGNNAAPQGGKIAAPQDGKIIVYDHGGAVGLLVDDVLRLSAGATAASLQGMSELLEAAFKVARRAPVERVARIDRKAETKAGGSLTAFLSFRVAGQLYGLPLEHIREVATLTGDISVIPNAASGVLGLIPMREGVLPLVSLATLLGLDGETPAREGARIVVVEHGGDLVGLVVDHMDVIRRLPGHAIGTVPAVLQRGRGDAQIEAIGRIADGGLLISILSPEKLFGHHAVAQAIGQNAGAKSMAAAGERDDAFEQFLIFQLGDENYGLPIGSVDEVIRLPDEITRVPGAPVFVMGVINLRGRAVPLIDQRSRFDVPASGRAAKARAIIVTLGSLQAGFVVDGVSEVKAIPSAALSAAPEFSSDRTDVFDRIAHIESEGRMVLLIDPQELLTRAERDVVTAVADGTTAVADP